MADTAELLREGYRADNRVPKWNWLAEEGACLFMKTSLNRLRGKSILDPRAASAEQLFLAPPFTEEVVAAIRLISTRLPLKADEASRLLWQKESNAASKQSTRPCCRS